jgi:hypothetical protein
MTSVIMLKYTVSLDLQSPVYITIDNQCLDTELISPVYFGNGAVCPKISDQQIDVGAKMKAYFEIYTTQDEFEGALLFKLQRCVESDNQHNIDTLTIESIRNEEKCVYMLVAWERYHSIPFAHGTLIEHTKEFTWDEDRLKKLHDKNFGWLNKHSDTISNTWCIDDNMALKTTFKVRDLRGSPELSIAISEGKDDYAIRPFCIDLER